MVLWSVNYPKNLDRICVQVDTLAPHELRQNSQRLQRKKCIRPTSLTNFGCNYVGADAAGKDGVVANGVAAIVGLRVVSYLQPSYIRAILTLILSLFLHTNLYAQTIFLGCYAQNEFSMNFSLILHVSQFYTFSFVFIFVILRNLSLVALKFLIYFFFMYFVIR